MHGTTVVLATHTSSVVDLAESLLVLNEHGSQEYYGKAVGWHKYADLIEVSDQDQDEGDETAQLPSHWAEVATLEPKGEESPTEEIETDRSGDMNPWAYYFRRMNVPSLIFIVVCAMVFSVSFSFPSQFTVSVTFKWLTENRNLAEDHHR